jgi:hypothetical protein
LSFFDIKVIFFGHTFSSFAIIFDFVRHLANIKSFNSTLLNLSPHSLITQMGPSFFLYMVVIDTGDQITNLPVSIGQKKAELCQKFGLVCPS